MIKYGLLGVMNVCDEIPRVGCPGRVDSQLQNSFPCPHRTRLLCLSPLLAASSWQHSIWLPLTGRGLPNSPSSIRYYYILIEIYSLVNYPNSGRLKCLADWWNKLPDQWKCFSEIIVYLCYIFLSVLKLIWSV